MPKKLTIIILFFCLILVMFSTSRCYYDSKEYLYPQINNVCDTTNVTFLKSVKPILDSYCVTCHSSSFSSKGVILDNYADVKIQATNGQLVSTIKLGVPNPMPQTGKLTDCQIATIQKWVNAQAPNN